ncbi:MAG TPA: Xaa-Pro peptidase family protein, partial [Sphingomonas sp.]|nr:Xaa-Pro peptidase family protein [Sphingomonas sp.]
MRLDRRTLIRAAAATPMLALPGVLRAAEPDLSALQDITKGAVPIGNEERAARLARAQKLMQANGIGAVLIEGGSSLIYFTGLRWGRSERLTAVVLPAEGEPCIITPFFEEARTREGLAIPAEVRVWNEDENPLETVAGFLKDRKLAHLPVGIEETVRYFAVDGLQKVGLKVVSANPIVRGCRMIKTAPEIALMQLATDVTIAAYRWVHPRVEKGMSQRDVSALMDAATKKLGGSPEFSMVLVGEGAAYPHGTKVPSPVADGRIVLMDCGCTVQGYQSDVSRTWVHGTATGEQRKVWDQVARGQQTAFAAAKLGVTAGSV